MSELIIDADFDTITLDVSDGVDSIIFKNCKGKSLSFNSKQAAKLVVDTCEIELFKISHLALDSLVISNSIIQKLAISGEFQNIELNYSKIEQVQFDRTISKTITLVESTLTSKLSLYKSSVTDSLRFNNSDVNGVNIEFGTYKEILFEEGSYGEVKLSPELISNLVLKNRKAGIIQWRVFFKTLDLSNCSSFPETRIRIYDASIERLILSHFENRGEFRISNTFIRNCRLLQTRLGNCIFNNVKLKNLNILHSNITEGKFFNTTWPKDNVINIELVNEVEMMATDSIRLKELYGKLADSYRQLKAGCLASEDKYNALAFQKNEMTYLWKLTNVDWKMNFSNWLILGSYKLFSDFGDSLLRPLAWLMAVHTILLTILFSTNPSIGITPLSDITLNGTTEAVSIYLKTIFPIHEYSAYKSDKLNLTGVAVDVTMRIASAYFIYYFIKASRKLNLSI